MSLSIQQKLITFISQKPNSDAEVLKMISVLTKQELKVLIGLADDLTAAEIEKVMCITDAARIMGQLHESQNPDFLKYTMDLYNNELGISIALSLSNSAGNEILIQAILSSITNGSGQRLNIGPGEPLSTNLFDTDGTNRCN
ncbi:MAG: hypothetical protein U0X91_24120 [Spirosomataceae bacterium]